VAFFRDNFLNYPSCREPAADHAGLTENHSQPIDELNSVRTFYVQFTHNRCSSVIRLERGNSSMRGLKT
jgi:hypothetical protein